MIPPKPDTLRMLARMVYEGSGGQPLASTRGSENAGAQKHGRWRPVELREALRDHRGRVPTGRCRPVTGGVGVSFDPRRGRLRLVACAPWLPICPTWTSVPSFPYNACEGRVFRA